MAAAVALSRGRRHYQEDRAIATTVSACADGAVAASIQEWCDSTGVAVPTDLVVVCDGHRGHRCAEHVIDVLPAAFLRNLAAVLCTTTCQAAAATEAAERAFAEVDTAWLTAQGVRGIARKDGCAAVLVFRWGTREWSAPRSHRAHTSSLYPGPRRFVSSLFADIFAGWAGDCRAVVCFGREAFDLTTDHKPERLCERDRVVAAGGTVRPNGRGELRAYPGGFSLTRAFGDYHEKCRCLGLISAPECILRPLPPDARFVLVASDGIWCSLSSRKAAHAVRSALGRASGCSMETRPGCPATELCAAAAKAGSIDNAAVVYLPL